MKQSFQIPLIAGASLLGMMCTTALADKPVSQGVIIAPAPEATLLELKDLAPMPRGGDMTVQNDTLADGGNAVLQFGFVNGEIGAARYIIDPALFPIQIKKIQIYWQSGLSNGTQSLQDGLLIYTGNFNLFAQLEGPVLTDGVLNEFDLSALNIVINSPTTITAGLQFFDAPAGNGLKPTLATDDNGCQNNLSAVFDPGSSQWFNLCAFGVAGDLVIRIVIDPMGSIIPCTGDINDDGVIDAADLGLLLAVFGDAPPSIAEADINGDGIVDAADLGLLLGVFGDACP